MTTFPRDYRPPQLHPEHRRESVTVEIGSVNGGRIHLTYAIEVTVWSGTAGVGGYVSVSPREVHLPEGDIELT
jgi:hypothetical protein